MLPRRMRVKPSRESGRIRSPSHLAWVREHACSVRGCVYYESPIQAAHVRGSMDGGMGMKPGDNWTISLCAAHHAIQHQIGEEEFGFRYGVRMESLAQEFAQKSPKLRNRLTPRKDK